MVEDPSCKQRLESLVGTKATDWTEIGRLLLDLESGSRANESGQPWQDVIRAQLDSAGAPISAGHIYKIRRAYAFLREQGKEAIVSDRSIPPKISSIELVERLFRIDRDAGIAALEEALAPIPVPYVELKRRYDAIVDANPDMKSAHQVAWDMRREAAKKLDDKSKSTRSEGQDGSSTAQDQPQETSSSGPSAGLRETFDRLLSQVWDEGWRAAERVARQKIEALETQISEQSTALEKSKDGEKVAWRPGCLSTDAVNGAADKLRGASDLYIYAPPELDNMIGAIFEKAFPKIRSDLPLKPQILRRRDGFRSTPQRFNSDDAALVLCLRELPTGFDFATEAANADSRGVPFIVIQAASFVLDDRLADTCHVLALDLPPELPSELLALQLASAVAEIRMVAGR